MILPLITFVLGAIVAFLISWYWVRKYGANLENKVNEVYDKFEDEVKNRFNEYFEQVKSEIKDQLAKKTSKNTKNTTSTK